MMIVAAAVLVIGALVFTLLVRAQDLPEPEPVSPIKHLEERKSTIYDNLRDLQFEYRVGKLSDSDYQQTKQDLQKELAAVLAEIDAIAGRPVPPPKPARPVPSRDRKGAVSGITGTAQSGAPSRDRKGPVSGAVCPHCGAKFANPMKFCGECGKPIPVEASK